MPRPKTYLFALGINLFLVFACTFAWAVETFTLETYYPAPYGSYYDLIVADRQAIGDVNLDTFIDQNDLAVDTTGNPIPASLTVAGNIGIGTAYPRAKMDIFYDNPSDNGCKLLLRTGPAGGNVGMILGHDWPPGGEFGWGIVLLEDPQESLVFNKDYYQGDIGTEHMRIEGITGNVGIGTSGLNVGARLEVVNRTIFGNNSRTVLIRSEANGVASPSTGYALRVNRTGVADTNIAAFLQALGGTVNNWAMYVVAGDVIVDSAAGNVGIGATDPSQRLDVDGQIRIRQGNPGIGKVLTDIDGTGTAEWSGGRFGGMYEEGEAGGGCETPNPFTGACSCPPGYAIQTLTKTCEDLDPLCNTKWDRITFCYVM